MQCTAALATILEVLRKKKRKRKSSLLLIWNMLQKLHKELICPELSSRLGFQDRLNCYYERNIFPTYFLETMSYCLSICKCTYCCPEIHCSEFLQSTLFKTLSLELNNTFVTIWAITEVYLGNSSNPNTKRQQRHISKSYQTALVLLLSFVCLFVLCFCLFSLEDHI